MNLTILTDSLERMHAKTAGEKKELFHISLQVRNSEGPVYHEG